MWAEPKVIELAEKADTGCTEKSQVLNVVILTEKWHFHSSVNGMHAQPSHDMD